MAPSRVESPNRLARPGQGSELRASDFHLPRAGPPPNSAESASESRQYLSNWRKPSKALKCTELRTRPSNFQLAKPLGAVSKHENPKPAFAVHASAIVSSPEPVFALLSLGHITGCDLVRIPNGWASVSLGDRLFSDSTAAFLNADQCLILQGMDARRHDFSGALWKNRFELAGIVVLAFLPSCASCLPCLESCRVSQPAA